MITNLSRIRVDEIDIVDRQRKDLGDLSELKESIVELGLIQPIVIEMITEIDGIKETKTYPRLIAGRRRLSCLFDLQKEFLYHGVTCDPERPGFVFYNEQNEEKRMLVEFEEDVRRKARTWQEEVLAIAKIHKVRWLLNAEKGLDWGQKETGRLLGVSAAKMSYTMALAEEMKREPEGEVAKSEGYTDAIKLLMARTDNVISEEQKRRREAVIATVTSEENVVGLPLFVDNDAIEPTVIQLSNMVHNGTFIGVGETLAPGCADCVLALGKIVQLDWKQIVRLVKENSYIIVREQDFDYPKSAPYWSVFWNVLGLNPVEEVPFLQNLKEYHVLWKGKPKPFNPSATQVFSSPEVGLHSFIDFLLRSTSPIGSTILMPCGGPCEAIAKIGRFPLSFEPDKARFDTEVKALREHYESTLPKVEFR